MSICYNINEAGDLERLCQWKVDMSSHPSLLSADKFCQASVLHSTAQGFRERAQVPQLVMLCRRLVHLQCFAGHTGCTHGTTACYCVAGKRAQYCNIRPFKKIKGLKYLYPFPNSLDMMVVNSK